MQPTPEFRAHHVAVSVRDLDKTVAFYARLGSRRCRAGRPTTGRSRSPVWGSGGSCSGVLLRRQCPGAAVGPGVGPAVGNDLEVVGVKRLALAVDDVASMPAGPVGDGLRVTEVLEGRTGLVYCFALDPDGYWVEIVQGTPTTR